MDTHAYIYIYIYIYTHTHAHRYTHTDSCTHVLLYTIPVKIMVCPNPYKYVGHYCKKSNMLNSHH